jgi:hypothetical protein
MSEFVVKLPSPCDRCRCLTGKIIDAGVVCTECGAHRMPVSENTRQFLTRVSQMFGAPAEIVFRTSDARDKIAQQDMLLSNKYSSDGRSWHQIITESMGGDAPIDSDAVGAIDPTEL